MFFVLGKRDWRLARWKIASPFFLLIWGSVAFLTIGLTYSVRMQFTDAELRETEQQLNVFLQENAISRFQFRSSGSGDRSMLSGLAFIRIISGDDRLLLAKEDISSPYFHELLNLDPHVSVPWLRLHDKGQPYVWTVVARELESGIIIQVGKESAASYRLYRNIVQVATVVLFGAFFLSWWVAILCAKKTIVSLDRLREELAALIGGGKELLLPEEEDGQELGALYRQVNGLLRQNRNLVSEMQASLDNVAHDLRTPMTRLRSVAEYGLQADSSEPDRLREALSDCLEESERVLAMLRIMMSVAEAESGTMRLECEGFDLQESLQDMISLYEYVAEERRITIRSLDPGQLHVYADRTRMSQVWANLLDNAIKYGKEGGWVQICTEVSDGLVSILFQDNGIGISANEQERIWERLYRGDRSRSRPGLGLGLNFVKAVVEAHGGSVTVDSTLHQGSCFTVALPLYHLSDGGVINEKSQTRGE